MKAIGEKGKPLIRVSGGSGREFQPTGITFHHLLFLRELPSRVDGFLKMPIQAQSTLPHQTGRWKNQHFMNGLTNVLSNMLKISDVPTKNCPNQGAALLFDGHSSHISYRILKLAMENNIQIVKLPSHLTDKIQPLDKCVFGPIKSCWGKKN